MKRTLQRTIWILALIVIMLLPPIRVANAADFDYYTSIFIYKNPNKMEYYVGESFDKTGMEIHGNLLRTNGTTTVYKLGLQNMTFSPAQFTKAGKIKVTISVPCLTSSGKMEPLTTSLYVDVFEEEGDPPWYWTYKITAKAEKTVYLVGEEFDKSGLKVYAHSEGYYPPEDETWDCTKYVKKISPTKFTKAGEQYVTVSADLTGQHTVETFTAKIKVKVYNKIKITKHPGGEIVNEGGSCAFTVKAENATKFTWYFVKGNDVIPVKEKNDSRFPGLKASGIHEKKLKLSHIPIELDGWSVMCEFTNPADSAESDTASIQVKGKETPTPKPEPTAAPTPEITPTPVITAPPTQEPKAEPVAEITPEPTAKPADTPAPAPAHTHSFDGVYHKDSRQHWLECACGERTGTADHVVAEWKTLSEPIKGKDGIRSGACAVCGEEVIDFIPYRETEEKEDPMSWLLIVGLTLAGVAVLGCIVAVVIVIAKKSKKNDPEE